MTNTSAVKGIVIAQNVLKLCAIVTVLLSVSNAKYALPTTVATAVTGKKSIVKPAIAFIALPSALTAELSL